MGLHGVRPGTGVRNVLQVKLGLGLAVDPQTENSVLGQVHVGLLVARALHLGVKGHLEVAVLQQVGLILVGLYQGAIAVGRPGSRKHVKKS